MESNTISKGILNAVYKVFLICLLIFLLYDLKEIIIYISIAAVLALLGRPIALFLQNKFKFSALWSATTTLLFFLLIIIGIISLFIPLIFQQANSLSLLNVDELEAKFIILTNQLSEFVGWDKNNLSSIISSNSFFSSIGLSSIPNFLNSFIGVLGNFTIGFFSVLFAGFFFLKDSKLLERTALIFVKQNQEKQFINALEKIKDLLSRYFVGLVFQITILLIIYTVVLLIIEVPNAFIIAFLCALLNLIPYLGPIIGAFLISVLTMTSFIDSSFTEVILPNTIYVLIGFSLGQLVDNIFSQPFIFSKSVKSHPLEIFIVIMIAGSLFGIIGLITAIPAYTSIKVMLKTFYANNKIVKSLTKDI